MFLHPSVGDLKTSLAKPIKMAYTLRNVGIAGFLPRRYMKIKNLSIIFLFVAILPAGCQVRDEKGQSPVQQLIKKLLPENASSKQKKALEKLSSPDPDLRREGVMAIRTSSIKDLPATHEVLAIMAKGDLNPQVRATSLETLALLNPNYEKMSSLLAATIKDDSPLVRRQSVMILTQKKDPANTDPLIDRLVSDDDIVVRELSAAALGDYPNRKVLRALIDCLDDEFGVAYRARQSLEKLTSRDFDYDISRWLSWLSETADPFAETAGSKSGS
jgi:hypothetical protein